MIRILFVAAGVAVGCASAAPPKNGDGIEQVRLLERDFIADAIEQGFAFAANLQPPGTRYDKLPDVSLSAVRAREERLDRWHADLRAVDPKSLRGTPALLARELMLGALESSAAARPCRFELWVASAVFGWQGQLVEALRSQPVDTDALRSQALERISVEAPRFIAQQGDNMREGMRRGYLPARAALVTVIDQLNGLLADSGQGSVLQSPGGRSGDAAFTQRVAGAVVEKLMPALRAHRDFLRDTVLPVARVKEGVSNLPDGEACYRGALKRVNNLDLDPGALHQVGLQQIDVTEASMRLLSARSFGALPVPELIAKLRTDPQYLFKSRTEMIDEARATVERGWAALPKAFSRVPASKVIVEPFAAFEEKTNAPRYFPASLDGAKPARFMIRTYQAEKQSRVSSEDLVFHETIPGHHLQFALLPGTPGLPGVALYTRSMAFVEGWALYGEGLADELGLYSDDAQRIGMLSSRNWRAARIVVDTGIHAFGWDREKAIEYLLAHASLSHDFAASEVDRYISMPGQATAYMVGYLEITRLRHEAERVLGRRFDLKSFHDRVLEQGIVPLPLLAAHVEEWIAKSTP